MKYLLVLIILVCGCVPEERHGVGEVNPLIDKEYMKIVSIKDERGNKHEYIKYWVGSVDGGGSITHYPDCQFCKENKDGQN